MLFLQYLIVAGLPTLSVDAIPRTGEPTAPSSYSLIFTSSTVNISVSIKDVNLTDVGAHAMTTSGALSDEPTKTISLGVVPTITLTSLPPSSSSNSIEQTGGLQVLKTC